MKDKEWLTCAVSPQFKKDVEQYVEENSYTISSLIRELLRRKIYPDNEN